MDGITPLRLEVRRDRLRRAIRVCIVASAIAAVVLAGTFQPSTGIDGVHVSPKIDPEDLVGWPTQPIRQGAGWIQHATAVALACLALPALGFLVYGLVRRHMRLVLMSFSYCVIAVWIAPVPTRMQPQPPNKMTVAVADRFIDDPAHFFSLDNVSLPYMAAQIAYLRGDFTQARRLSRGLSAGRLGSPIESAYRLQYLQGRPVALSNVALQGGILTVGTLRIVRLAAGATLAFALGIAIAGAIIWRIVQHRVHRIERLIRMLAREA